MITIDFYKKYKVKIAILTLLTIVISFLPLNVGVLFADANFSTPSVILKAINTNVIAGQNPFYVAFDITKRIPSDPRPTKAHIFLQIKESTTNSCFAFDGQIVKTLFNGDLPEGSYGGLSDPTFSWNGTTASGNEYVAEGDYCYRFTSTAPSGSVVYNRTSGISVSYPAPPPTSGNTGISGGTGTGAADSGPQTPTSQSRIKHTVHPSTINLQKIPRDYATIEFTILQALPGRRLTMEIYGPDGIMANGSFLDYPTSAGTTGTFLWDGSCTGGRLHRSCNESTNGFAESGNYTYKFFAGGEEIDWGRIVVDNTYTPPPLFIINHRADPQSFNSGGSTRILFTTGKQVSNLRVEVLSSDLLQRKTLPLEPAVDNSAPPGNYAAFWDGKFNDLAANPGTYTYKISATNENTVFGTISVLGVIIPPGTGQFVVNHRVSPEPIEQGQSTKIYFTTGKRAQTLRIEVMSSDLVTLRKILPITPLVDGYAEAGNYEATWDGFFTGVTTTPVGTYIYKISALNETPVSGSIRVIQSQVPPVTLQLTDLGPSRNPFSPANSDTTEFRFQLNQNARVDVSISQGTRVIKRLLVSGINNNMSSGVNSVVWNGASEYHGRILDRAEDNGLYTYIIDARNDRGEAVTRSGSIEIRNGATPPPSNVLAVIDLGANPDPFDPEEEDTEIRYSLSHDASVSIVVRRTSDNAFTATVMSNRERTAGNNSAFWDGRDSNGFFVSDGDYRYTISAVSSAYGTDSDSGEVTARRNGGGGTTQLQLIDLGPTKTVFNPRIGETTTLRFETNFTDVLFNVEILDGFTENVIKQLQTSRSAESVYRYQAVWDGKDSYGRYVANDTYAYRIRAFRGSEMQERTGFVRVTGSTTLPPDEFCAGFRDVPSDHELCPAIEFVVRHGIFLGDSGRNTLRLDEMLKRAETVAVTQRAFGYTIDSYSSSEGKLGFRDLNPEAWYMPHIKTYLRRKVLRGYPDKLMRPNRTMVNAELYRVFVEGALQGPEVDTDFVLERNVTQKPFFDTPIAWDTRWYLPYADFARVNNLTAHFNYFNPGRGITRGQVIKLIYDTHIKGLIAYGISREVSYR